VAPADPAQPWRVDRAWDPAGEPGELERRARRATYWGVASLAVLLPWNALAAGRPDLLWPGLALAADVIPVLLLLRAAWLRRAWRRGGAPRLRLDRFPFFLGEPLEAVLTTEGDGDGRGAVEVTLACLERRPDELSGELVEVEVFRSTQVIRPALETAVLFELPAPERGLGTVLEVPAARRWELRVSGRSGARAREAFAVPVYAPPVEGEREAG
jgi:hypothetical protein